MKRTAALTDFLLVTVAVTTILLSLLPVGLRQQSPAEMAPAEMAPVEMATAETASTATPEIKTKVPRATAVDSATAVANWQNEVAQFYAQRDQQVKRDQQQASLASTPSPVQVVSYNETVTPAAKMPATSTSKPTAKPKPTTSTATVHYGLVLQDQHVSMTFFFAIVGGVLLGLGYLEWSRQTPEVSPTTIEFHADDQEPAEIDFDAKWGAVAQRKAVQARRATLACVVIWALISVIS